MPALHYASQNTPRYVSSGVIDYVSQNDGLIIWYSSTSANKSENITAGSIAGQTVILKDGQGTAGTYPITIAASGCTIDHKPSYSMNQNDVCVALTWDGSTNWCIT